jgi:membrane fusion protein (multidrug efflux system)
MREAELAANEQQQASQQAQIEEARAGVSVAAAEAARADKDLERSRRLVATGVVSNARLDDSTAAAASAKAQTLRAQATLRAQSQMLGMMGSNRAQLEAAVAAAQAAAKLSELDLAATEVRAPIDGTVGDLAAHVGERVEAGRRLLSLVPLSQVYVEANFKETQLDTMATGQQVSIKVDAYPGRALRGHVESFSPASGAEFALLPPDNATGNFNKVVQRLPVRIALDDTGGLSGLLRPGMSVEAEIDTRTSPATTASR